MPYGTLDWSLEATWDAAYRDSIGGVSLHYQRAAWEGETRKQWDSILAVLTPAVPSSVLVLGCGYGWGLEYLLSLGHSPVGVDTSNYIQGKKGDVDPFDGRKFSEQEGLVTLLDISTSAGRRDLRKLVNGANGGFDLVVSEMMVSTLTDAEAVQVDGLMHTAAKNDGTVVHVDMGQHPDPANYNVRTPAEWLALFEVGTRFLDISQKNPDRSYVLF